MEMPELIGDLEGFKFLIRREAWYEKDGSWGRPLTVAVVPEDSDYIWSSTPKAYAYDNEGSVLRAAKRAKKEALSNIQSNRAKHARYGKWEGSYPPKKLSEV